MNTLDKIIARKRYEVERDCLGIPSNMLERVSADQRIPYDFGKSLRVSSGLAVIAEIKKASPSKGIIREDFRVLEIAESYQRAGAAALSVLTDETFFHGSAKHLRDVRQSVELPLLRKDFIIDERQIRETYEMGADAILFIVACLRDEQLIRFGNLARSFGLTCLIEVHDERELTRALSLGFEVIGINNRNLKTFRTDLRTSLRLKQQIQADIICVSESGINTASDIAVLADAGFDALLIGEAFMREPDAGEALRRLMNT